MYVSYASQPCAIIFFKNQRFKYIHMLKTERSRTIYLYGYSLQQGASHHLIASAE